MNFPFRLHPIPHRKVAIQRKSRRLLQTGQTRIASLFIKSIPLTTYRAFLKLRNNFFLTNHEFLTAAVKALCKEKGLVFEDISRSVQGRISVSWEKWILGHDYTTDESLFDLESGPFGPSSIRETNRG